MKKLALLGSCLLVCSASAYSQAPDNTSRPAQNPDSNSSQSSETGSGNSKKTTIVGCISERNGKYILKTNNQSTPQSSGAQSNDTSSASSGQSTAQSSDQSRTQSKQADEIELVGTQDLKQHVGHTVRVTGTMEMSSATDNKNDVNNNATQPSTDKTNSQSGTLNNENRMNQSMRVTDMQMVSQSCEMKGNTSSQSH